MSEHSPGPWRWDARYDECLDANVARVFLAGLDGGAPPSDVDARLIAAAPELLEALKAFTERWEGDGCVYCGSQEWNTIDGMVGLAHALRCPMTNAAPLIARIEGE